MVSSAIVEYVAQTRGWFYTLMVEAAAIMEKHPFENAICHGVILADDGRKMSKSLKNFPDPMKVVEEHGSDGLRIYLLSSAVVKGADIRFSEKGVKESVRRYLIPLWNSLHFFTSYAQLAKGYTPEKIQWLNTDADMADRHILSELETLKQQVDLAAKAYDQRVILCIEMDGNYSDSFAAHKEWLMAQTLAQKIETCVSKPFAELKDENGILKIQVVPVN